MKKHITNLKNKTVKFAKDNETVIKLSVGYIIGATVMYNAYKSADASRWNKAELLAIDKADDEIVVKTNDGRFAIMRLNKDVDN